MTVTTDTSVTDPFATVLKHAKENEERKQAAAKKAENERRARQEARRAVDHRRMTQHGIDSMNLEFLSDVANYVTHGKMSPVRIEEVAGYARLMLSTEDVELPRLSAPEDARKVISQFGETLKRVRHWNNTLVPEGYFFGERLYNQQVAAEELRRKQSAERRKMHIPAGIKPRGARPENNTGRAVDLAPAITPKPAGNKRNKRKKR